MTETKERIPEFNSLLHKFTELLTGEATPERIEMVKIWSLYSHMLKVMPPLVKHWTAEEGHQEAKKQIREIFEEVQRMNEENKAKIREHQSKHLNKSSE
jgi:hypothetical protein